MNEYAAPAVMALALLFVGCEQQEKASEGPVQPVPAPVTVPEAKPAAPVGTTPPASNKWYEGGTLAYANRKAWLAATPENRLATSAERAMELLEEGKWPGGKPASYDLLRPHAEWLMKCVDDGHASGPEKDWFGLCAHNRFLKCEKADWPCE